LRPRRGRAPPGARPRRGRAPTNAFPLGATPGSYGLRSIRLFVVCLCVCSRGVQEKTQPPNVPSQASFLELSPEKNTRKKHAKPPLFHHAEFRLNKGNNRFVIHKNFSRDVFCFWCLHPKMTCCSIFFFRTPRL
jgi:hypothetical protein